MKGAVERAAIVLLLSVAAAVRFRTVSTWMFVGADSYGYVGLAEELWNHGRYGLGPGHPPHVGRLPLYPIFVALVKRNHPALMSGGEGWERIRYAQVWLDLLTLPVLYTCVRRAFGAPDALLALALLAVCPLMAIYDGAALTEPLATALTTLTLATLLVVPDRPRLAFGAAGALAGLSALTRPDGILLLSAFVPAFFALRSPGRERRIAVAFAAAAFAAVYGPWPIRNVLATGTPYFLGTRVDASTRPLPRYHGWWRWTRSWSEDWWAQTLPSTCFYSRLCEVGLERFPDSAFDSPAERAAVGELLSRHAREGNTPEVDAGFESIGARREQRRFWRANVSLPLRRAYHMWVSDFEEPLQNRRGLWPFILALMPFRRYASACVVGGILAATAVVAVSPRRRWPGLILITPILVRTLVLGYANYSMPRYRIEVLPGALTLIAVALVEVAERAGRLTRRAGGP